MLNTKEINTKETYTSGDFEAIGNFEYRVLEDDTLEITKYTGSETEIKIPSEIDGTTVTCIGTDAFKYLPIKHVVIPSSVNLIRASFRQLSIQKIDIYLTDDDFDDGIDILNNKLYFSCYDYTEVNLINEVTGEVITAQKCYNCGEFFEQDSTVYCDDNEYYYCENCAYDELMWCEYTDEYHLIENMVKLQDSDEWVYEDYAKRNFYQCSQCGDWYKYFDNLYEDNCHDLYCESCYNNGWGNFSNDNCLDDYHDSHYNRNIEFFDMENETRNSTPYMGFELEVDEGYTDYIDDTIYNIANLFPREYFAFEKDGSLDNGWENISQPASLNYHLYKLPEYQCMFKHIKDAGYKSHDAGTCGLHIHIDKKYFGNKLDSSEAKLVYLFQKHWNNFLRFSRRTEYQTTQWAGRYDNEGSLSNIVKNGKSKCLSRYKAVNLTNDNTIEIRLWRGTLNIETFEATLKLTARLAELCKNTPTRELVEMSFEKLLGEDEVVLRYWDRVKNRSI